LSKLFWGLVLTQPFSLDCHHTLFFWSLAKVRKKKIIRLLRMACNNSKQIHFSPLFHHIHPTTPSCKKRLPWKLMPPPPTPLFRASEIKIAKTKLYM